MKSMISQVFTEKYDKRIAPQRGMIVVRLMLALRKEISKVTLIDDGAECNIFKEYITATNQKYDKMLSDFIREFNGIFSDVMIK